MTDTISSATQGQVADRVAADDWDALTDELGEFGHALTGPLLTPGECHRIAGLYDEAERFRTTIDMARYRFGSGQYRYFTHDLPDLVRELRGAFYPRLLPIARDWARKLDRPAPWPDTLEEWLTMCHEAGQAKSAQILLRYGPGDWNALHRDVFGEMLFPLQVVVGLDAPGEDFTGGEFIMTEQRPRAQSRGSSTTLPKGHGLIFTTRDRPVASKRGWANGPMRHGVSTVRSGHRHTLGLVFHDAA
ncbi:2OG-Fe(II) oxygenase [Streptomyces botrytidirepellens]|uniref:Proline hydroxylase n=1 Tax=Streptomyces botrytidirepellens TaxID=2486417 RepID=A0A3M8T8F7_9ACTN|nr:2OG-Fe(II) oxygenase [Streptomyces botrytidirepellens]RNF87804.1 proline hydroxylase [Streptomyces botrytidirepellens]